jgi:hypothetical protein
MLLPEQWTQRLRQQMLRLPRQSTIPLRLLRLHSLSKRHSFRQNWMTSSLDS